MESPLERLSESVNVANIITDGLGWLLTAVALTALAWCFLADSIRRRFRRARRCPKCWYDLSYTLGMTCSECGFTAKRERQLFRWRRRWRWVVAALMLWAGSYFAFRAPEVRERGWVAAVPDTVLIFVGPSLHIERGRGIALAALGLSPETFNEHAFVELRYRMERTELSCRQWQWLIPAALREGERRHGGVDSGHWPERPYQLVLAYARASGHFDDPALLERALKIGGFDIQTRRRWPVDEPIYAHIRPMRGFDRGTLTLRLTPLDEIDRSGRGGAGPSSSANVALEAVLADPVRNFGIIRSDDRPGKPPPWTDDAGVLIASSTPRRDLRFVLEARRELTPSQRERIDRTTLEWTRQVVVPTAIGGTIDEILRPIESPEFDAELRDRLAPYLLGDDLHLPMAEIVDAFDHLGGATFAVTAEVIYDDTVMAVGEAWWARRRNWPQGNGLDPRGAGDRIPLRPIANPKGHRLLREIPEYTLRLRPNRRIALRNFESDRYWSGEIVMPVQWGWLWSAGGSGDGTWR